MGDTLKWGTPFLDVLLIRNGNKIETAVYCKKKLTILKVTA